MAEPTSPSASLTSTASPAGDATLAPEAVSPTSSQTSTSVAAAVATDAAPTPVSDSTSTPSQVNETASIMEAIGLILSPPENAGVMVEVTGSTPLEGTSLASTAVTTKTPEESLYSVDPKFRRSDGGWYSLPTELHIMVLGFVVAGRGSTGSCASVCKQWQTIVEEINFSRLTVTPKRLRYFENQFDIRRQKLVKHICLRIGNLKNYKCPACDAEPNIKESDFNAGLFQRALARLLCILATWESHDGDLMLEIDFGSQSDEKHFFRHRYFGMGEALQPSDLDEVEKEHSEPHDPTHGWHKGEQLFPPTARSIHRLHAMIFLDPLILSPAWHRKKLARSGRVEAVTGLLIRRQTRRTLTPNMMRFLLGLFPRLKHFRYEGHVNLGLPTTPAHGPFTEPSEHHPWKPKSVSLFLDFNEDDGKILSDNGEDTKIYRLGEAALSYLLGGTTDVLEELSGSFVIDAKDFFLNCLKHDWVWERLERLALTTILMEPDNLSELMDLLHRAAVAARRMPKLRIMELWNGIRGSTAVFRYHSVDEGWATTITWRGTWDVELPERVTKAWAVVAMLHGRRRRLRVVKDPLDGEVVIDSHGDAIHHLGLMPLVVHPVSLWQIRKEAAPPPRHPSYHT